MHLTREEEHVYNGDVGWAKQVSMRILVRLGDLFGAEKLIPIDSAHVSGVSYKTLGDAPIRFLEALASADAKVTVRTTLNPQSLDAQYLTSRVDRNTIEKQSSILRQFEKMGIMLSLTCTPYYLRKPLRGAHLAWAESSAVVYSNSVLKAWTNREGGPSALAAAIIGKTPDYGTHRRENRSPKVLVDVEAKLVTETDYGALGIFLGKALHDEIPAIHGLEHASEDDLKQLSAALASSGMTNMFQQHIAKGYRQLEKISVGSKEIEETKENLSTARSKPDLVFIGCPHCSISEIKRVAQLIQHRNVRTEREFWVCTSCHVKQKAGKYVKQIEKAGGHVLDGVCTIVSWTEKLAIRTIMTNSAKTAHYAPTLSNAQPCLAPMEACIDALS
jgi:predicted aconitase